MEERSRPILSGQGETDYERYLRTDELLSLQKSPDQVVHHDEHLFQAVHQASELWLKLACVEVERSTSLLVADNLATAVRLLRRATDVLSLVIDQLHMLEHLSPTDYAVVRTALGHGAGFDSPGFRRVQRSSPGLGDAFAALLKRRGVAPNSC
jgi:tryptophan 2,3-dioxygenase